MTLLIRSWSPSGDGKPECLGGHGTPSLHLDNLRKVDKPVTDSGWCPQEWGHPRGSARGLCTTPTAPRTEPSQPEPRVQLSLEAGRWPPGQHRAPPALPRAALPSGPQAQRQPKNPCSSSAETWKMQTEGRKESASVPWPRGTLGRSHLDFSLKCAFYRKSGFCTLHSPLCSAQCPLVSVPAGPAGHLWCPLLHGCATTRDHSASPLLTFVDNLVGGGEQAVFMHLLVTCTGSREWGSLRPPRLGVRWVP